MKILIVTDYICYESVSGDSHNMDNNTYHLVSNDFNIKIEKANWWKENKNKFNLPLETEDYETKEKKKYKISMAFSIFLRNKYPKLDTSEYCFGRNATPKEQGWE